MLITKDKTVILTGQAKAKHLEPIKGNDVTILSRTKDTEHNKKLFTEFIDDIAKAGDTVGMLPKDKYQGTFVNEWKEAYNNSDKKFTEVDVASALGHAMEVKDEEELRTIRNASKASGKLMTNYFADKMSRLIDEEKAITHSKLSEEVENKIEDHKYFKDMKLSDLDPYQLDWCYSPIIQSGGKFDLRPSAMSDDNKLHAGVILCSLGLRYKSYCSNIGRTYLIDPNKEQEQNYTFLLSVQKKVISAIKDGAKCNEVYNTALEFIREKHPEMEQKFLKNVGWGVGIEFKDSTAVLNAKNTNALKDGMTLNVVVGFQDLTNSEAKKTGSQDRTYSLLLADTVRVGYDSSIIFTDSDKDKGNISYYFKQDEDDVKAEENDDDEIQVKNESKKTKNNDKKDKQGGGAKSAVLRSKLRGEGREKPDDTSEKRRQLHQKDLHDKLQKAGREKYADESTAADDTNKAVFKKFESYKRDTQIPSSVKDLKVTVDTRAQTIIVPINGRPVPFHINAYKNGSKNEEGEYVFLRLNFHSPGQASGKRDEMPFEDPNAQFLRSITLRSRDTERMHDVFKRIQDLKKEAVKRESERKELEDVVQQDKLAEMRKERPKRLDSVFVRPGPEGKRVAGSLEIHQNGIRYQSPVQSDHKIDLLFSNIENLFFQPCDNELIVVIHCHLKSPIIVGKKKTEDVQFYREASDMAFDETGNRKRRYRYGDEDELEQEQEERRRRQALNHEFKNFSEKISEQSSKAGRHIDVDTPFRQLGFNGVPFRSNVLLQPTTDCLVQLIDPPFSVINLHKVELAHLERVQFGLKQFDLVFIYKDYNEPVTHINSIPMDQLDGVKDWLNEMDIAIHEGPVNLNWTSIMKTVAADPHDFFVNGGWSFLSLEDEEDKGEEVSEESDFAPSDFNPSDESEQEEEEEDDEDAYSEDGSGSEAGGGSEEESGEDWDELDEKAKKEDKKAAAGGDDTKKRKR